MSMIEDEELDVDPQVEVVDGCDVPDALGRSSQSPSRKQNGASATSAIF